MSTMPTCSCTGVRSCALCQSKHPTQFTVTDVISSQQQQKPHSSCSFDLLNSHLTVPFCCNCSFGHAQSACGSGILLPGLVLIPMAIPDDLCSVLLSFLKNSPLWVDSQSGRKKMDFGPQVNFRERTAKIRKGYVGMPLPLKGLLNLTERVVEKATSLPFSIVECSALEYDPERGSSIDPHVDDVWAWGARIIVVSLCSEAVMSFVSQNVVVEVPLPPQSIAIISGESRYKWLHGIRREHVKSLRYSITMRELSPLFVEAHPLLANEAATLASTFV